jgi:hypothetical protein
MKLLVILFLFPIFPIFASDTEANDFARLPFPDFTKVSGAAELSLGGKVFYRWTSLASTSPDSELGIKNAPLIKGRDILRSKDRTIYDSTYTHDQFARRVTPVDKKNTYKKFIALFGCSFTYGYALNDNETINYFITKNNGLYFAYNYGIVTVGTNYVLSQMQNIKFQEQIPEKSGVFIYVFMTQHIQRAAGYLPTNVLQRQAPYFVKDVDGHMIRAGSIESARPFYSWALVILDKLFGQNLLAGRDFPKRSTANELYTCDLVVEMSKVLQTKSPANSFIVYLHPQFEIPSNFINCLKENKIKTIQGRMPGKLEDYTVQEDGHPNGKWNQIIANEILEFLK